MRAQRGDEVAAGQFMHTRAQYDRRTTNITFTTTTWTTNLLWGFHGCMSVRALHRGGTFTRSRWVRLGVDGQLIGRSSRTDGGILEEWANWTYPDGPVVALEIEHLGPCAPLPPNGAAEVT